MTRVERMRNALERRPAAGPVPLWELHFHLWARLSDEPFLTGPAYMALNPAGRRDALKRDAQILAELSDRLGFDALSIPDAPWACVYTLPAEDRLTLISELKALSPDVMVIGGCGGYIGMPSSSDDYMSFCYQVIDEPESIDEMARKAHESGIRALDAMADAGIDAVYAGSDLADNRGPFFSPAQLDRWVWPYQRLWADHAHARGVYAIMHTDGNIMPLLDRIAENGSDALQALDPVAGVSIAAVFDQVEGRLALCGNVDCGLMLAGTPDRVYDATADLLKAQRHRKGFILGNSNAVAWETPIENYMAYLSAWRDHGNNPE